MNLSSLYRGLFFKLSFNLPYATSLYLSASSNSEASILFSWLVTAALYPLSTLKVRSQLMFTDFAVEKEITHLFRSGLYRGVVPFLLINAVFGWTLRPLFSQQKLAALKESVTAEKVAALNK